MQTAEWQKSELIKNEKHVFQKYVPVKKIILFCAMNRKPVYRKKNTPNFRKYFLLGRGSEECIFSLPAWRR